MAYVSVSVSESVSVLNATNSPPHTKKYLTDNKYFEDSLKLLKERIESTNIFHQTEILRIFNDNGVIINENKNGVFINLTYVDYVNKQEDQLNEIEKEKEKIATSFFTQ